MEIKNCDMCTMPNCINRNLSSKEDCLLDKKLSANDSFDFLEQSLAKFAIDFAYKGKTLKECLDKYKSNIIAAAHTIEPTIPDIVDEHWWEMLGEEPISEELEEAAKHYLYSNILYDDVYVGNPTDKDCIEMFKAGANWQKQKDEKALNENALLYNARLEGIEIGKAEMMKNAKDGVITFDYYGDDDKIYGCIAHDSFSLEELGLKDGDKVKLIIIKEE